MNIIIFVFLTEASKERQGITVFQVFVLRIICMSSINLPNLMFTNRKGHTDYQYQLYQTVMSIQNSGYSEIEIFFYVPLTLSSSVNHFYLPTSFTLLGSVNYSTQVFSTKKKNYSTQVHCLKHPNKKKHAANEKQRQTIH